MGIWIFILVAVLAVMVIGIIYICKAIGRFAGIKNIAGESKPKKLIIPLGILVVFFALFTLITSFINAIIILIHLLLFWLIFDFLGFIVKKISKKTFKFYWQGWTALISCVIYMSIAYYLCANVWVTNYNLNTDKSVDKIHMVMFADSHVGAVFDGDGMKKHVQSINAENPDIVLIPGDFVDDGTNRENMIKACKALGEIKSKYGVYFAYGNHDKGYYGSEGRGYTNEELMAELRKNNVKILIDEYELIDDRFYVIGRADKSDKSRIPMGKLVEGLDKSKYMIVMDHQPADYAAEAQAGVDLVLSGHTHGGQFFPVTYVGEWAGLNDRTYGYEKRNNTDFLVTSGIADWELKFKTGTKSEYVVVDVGE